MKTVSMLTAAACLAVMGSAAAQNSSFLNPPQAEVTVAVEENYRPFSYINEATGEREGFDVGFTGLLCTKLKIKCRLLPLPFDEIIPALEQGRADLAVASLGRSPEREQTLAFSEPYFRSRAFFIGLKEYPFEIRPSNVHGMKLASQAATAQEEALKENYGNDNEILSYKDYDALFAALELGKTDLILVDGLSGYDYLKRSRNPDFILLNHYADNQIIPMDESCIAVSRENAGALEQINSAIYEIKIDGEYQMLSLQYFPFLNF